jgi:hypothetical protein
MTKCSAASFLTFDILKKTVEKFNRQQDMHRGEIASSLRKDDESWVQREAAADIIDQAIVAHLDYPYS